MRDSLSLGLYFESSWSWFSLTTTFTDERYDLSPICRLFSFFGLFDATLRGLGFAYLWPETPAINNLFLLPFIFIALWGAVSFSRNYLNAVEILAEAGWLL